MSALNICELAQRWAAKCPYCRNHPGRDIRDGTVSACPDCDGSSRVLPSSAAYGDGVDAGLIKPLDERERESLFAWVRHELLGACMPGVFADAVRESGLAGERDVLAYCVGRKIGGPFKPDADKWRRLVLSLCDAAGWPEDCA